MSGSAKSTNRAVTIPSTRQMRKKRLEATRNASSLALLEQLGEHRDERALQRRVGEQRAHEVRHLEGDGEGRHRPGHAEVGGRHRLAPGRGG